MCSGTTQRSRFYNAYIVIVQLLNYSPSLKARELMYGCVRFLFSFFRFSVFFCFCNCRSSTTPNTSDCVNQSQPFVNVVSYQIDRWWTGAVLAYAVVCPNSMWIPSSKRPDHRQQTLHAYAAFPPIRCRVAQARAGSIPSIRGAHRRVLQHCNGASIDATVSPWTITNTKLYI